MKLTKLEVLQLHQNALTGTIAPELGALTRLRFVGLDKNELTGTVPPTLAKLTNVDELLLQHNHLVGARAGVVAPFRGEAAVAAGRNASAVVGTSDNADPEMSVAGVGSI